MCISSCVIKTPSLSENCDQKHHILGYRTVDSCLTKVEGVIAARLHGGRERVARAHLAGYCSCRIDITCVMFRSAISA